MWEGARKPKYLVHFLALIPVSISVWANFIFRQLLSASVGIRQLPSPLILFNSDTMTFGRGPRKPKFLSFFLV